MNLQAIRHDLLDLHRALIGGEREDYERAHGRLADGEFLEALVNDPAFAWLSPLTALIVRLDELLEDEAPQPAAHDDCVAQIRKLLTPDPGGSEFQRRYAQVLQRRPDVVFAHGKTIRALKGAK
ncbi:MAG TPA: hypothetical protein VK143_08630 [Burkholderiales bacterium]|nr:hypothetical protein [Burkholderiales bacterium]